MNKFPDENDRLQVMKDSRKALEYIAEMQAKLEEAESFSGSFRLSE